MTLSFELAADASSIRCVANRIKQGTDGIVYRMDCSAFN